MPTMKNRPAVYIAGPYSSDPVKGTRAAVRAADRIWAAGGSPYVPHLTYLWDVISPKPRKEWLELDLQWLARCDVLLRLPGDSSGADGEVAFALTKEIPIYYGVLACFVFLKDHAAGVADQHHETCGRLCEWCYRGWPVQLDPMGGWLHFRPEEEESQDESPLAWERCNAGLLHEYRRKLMEVQYETD